MSSGRHPVIVATPEGLATPQIRDTPLRRPPARQVAGDGYSLSAAHSGWKGVVHRRRLTLSPDGTTLTGQEAFEGRGRATRHISVHFPLAPGLTVTEDENGLHLQLPTGVVWTFDAPDMPVLATHPLRIVIHRAVDRLPARLDWTLTRRDATAQRTEHQTTGEMA
nr:heparinase II/III family protein [Falsirhodobacter halotolerans]